MQQIQPHTFEYTINYLIDLSVFEAKYRNDETGAPAIDPAILLKVILFAYSRGILRSRRIAQCCNENVVFMALAADTRPLFSTIAYFISSMGNEITSVFRDILTVCYGEGLIGKRMFAVNEKRQVIVDAQAFGNGHEAKHLEAVVDSGQETFCALDEKDDVYEELVLTADK